MKLINMILVSALFACAGCSTEPLEEEQYKKQIYIVNSESTDIYYHRELSYQEEESETFISVACAGSLPQEYDVVVELEVVDSLLANYNKRFFEDDESKYLRMLPATHYRIPDLNVVLEANGNAYTRVPIYIQTTGLDRDVKYVIPFRIKSASAYELNEPISQMLFGFDLVNDYTDIYTMTGRKYNDQDVKSNMAGSREMWAIAHNAVRMFVETRTEDDENLDKDGMILTINEDNSVSIRAYAVEHLELVDLGGNTYDPVTKTFTLNYKYLNAADSKWYRLEEVLTIIKK